MILLSTLYITYLKSLSSLCTDCPSSIIIPGHHIFSLSLSIYISTFLSFTNLFNLLYKYSVFTPSLVILFVLEGNLIGVIELLPKVI